MIRKGMTFRPAPHLYFRSLQPGDRDSRGQDAHKRHGSYCVIVRRANCVDDEGRLDFDMRDKAPMHGPHSWSRTNMVYGGVRKNNRCIRVYRTVEGVERIIEQNVYWTRAVYWIEDAYVWQGTIRYYDKPKDA